MPKKFIETCVKSVLSQTFSDWELILIDDGSTDETPRLCDRLSGSDARIRAVHQENAGVSVARNRGIEMAAGDYLAFLDADDTVAPEAYGEMIAAMGEHFAAAAVCGYMNVSENGGSARVGAPMPDGVYGHADIMKLLIIPLLGDRISKKPDFRHRVAFCVFPL